jgi:hypothetical protein
MIATIFVRMQNTNFQGAMVDHGWLWLMYFVTAIPPEAAW